MPIRRPETTPAASLADAALTLADLLDREADRAGSETALALAAAHGPDTRLTLRRAEAALDRGDAVAALRLLVPAWEAGDPEPQLEALLALTALALDLEDVVQTLTEPPPVSQQHGVVRLVLGAARGEVLSVAGLGGPTELVWALRGVLRVLASCGRDDLVGAVLARSDDLRLPGLASALGHVPAGPRAAGTLRVPPLPQAREAFTAAWRGPAPVATFNWAWTVAREIGDGERVLLANPTPAAFRPLLDHARVLVAAPRPGPGVDLLAEPDRLPVGTARFRHIVAPFWLGAALDPAAALAGLAAAVGHGGFVHLLWPGPAADVADDVRLSPRAVERLLARAGLSVAAVASRAADGAAAEPGSAHLHLLRAGRSIV